MFNNADAFNQDISSFNVSLALSMRNMFIGCLRFNNGDTGNSRAKPLTSWASQMSSVTNVSGMFSIPMLSTKRSLDGMVSRDFNI